MLAITDMLYNRMEKHVKVGGVHVLINPRIYEGGAGGGGGECHPLYFF